MNSYGLKLRVIFIQVLLLFSLIIFAQNQEVEIPNVFTPNGDNINDDFKVDGLNGEWSLKIYDRWGSLIYASELFATTPWDGRNSLGSIARTGVYFFNIGQQGNQTQHTGFIHLIR